MKYRLFADAGPPGNVLGRTGGSFPGRALFRENKAPVFPEGTGRKDGGFQGGFKLRSVC